MRTLKFFLFCIIGMLYNVSSWAYDFEEGGFYYEITSAQEKTVSLTQGKTPYFGSIFVPRKVEHNNIEFKVTAINGAFISCNVDTLFIPKEILIIYEFSIMHANINTMIFEESSQDLLWTSGNGSLFVNQLDDGTLKEVVLLRNIVYTNKYSSGLFSNHALVNVCLGDKVTKIPKRAFSHSNIEHITLPQSLVEIGESAFERCVKLDSLTIPQSVKTIGINCFSGCEQLQTINFPRNLREIQAGTFSFCSELKNIELPNNLELIQENAFLSCDSLKSVSIPEHVFYIGKDAFGDCAFDSINVLLKEPCQIDDEAFSQSSYVYSILVVPYGTSNKYRAANVWKNFFNIVEAERVNQVSLNISCNEGGYVEFLNHTISNNFVSQIFDKGEKVKMTISAEEGYILKSVIVNGMDVTAEMENNNYTVTMDANTDVVVTFEKLPIYLTIQQADNGNTKLLIEEGKAYQIVVNPSIGWKINTVVFNNMDVTKELDADHKYTTPAITENSTLNVSFELETPAAVQELSANNISVRGNNGSIVVEGANQGDEITVYTIDGSMIASKISNGSNVQINVEDNQVYVVKVGQRTFKLSL